MRKSLLIAVLVVLAACVPEPEDPARPKEAIPAAEHFADPAHTQAIPDVQSVVLQERGGRQAQWGFDHKGRLVLLNSSERRVVLERHEDLLAGIDDGMTPLVFYHDGNGRLLSAQKGSVRWIFTYSATGRLLSIETGETLRFTYDSKGRLSSVRRDSGPSTELVYDELNRTSAILKNNIKTSMFYDSEGRLARIDREDDHLVIGYWRHDLLSSLSGTMYGLKETVNYGPEDITLVSNVEQVAFNGGNAGDRIDAFNTFLFCTRFRKLPVTFDGQSWVLAREYLGYNITDYVQMGFICDALP
jgi:YD repeat-containing protein